MKRLLRKISYPLLVVGGWLLFTPAWIIVGLLKGLAVFINYVAEEQRDYWRRAL